MFIQLAKPGWWKNSARRKSRGRSPSGGRRSSFSREKDLSSKLKHLSDKLGTNNDVKILEVIAELGKITSDFGENEVKTD